MKGLFISPEAFINFDPNPTQTQTLTLKLTSNLTLTQTLILNPKSAVEKGVNEHPSFTFRYL